MALYAIADLHLSLGTADKPMNIFPGWANHVERLEKNWRQLVRETDAVVIAGDISWAMKLEEAAADFAFIHSLPGTKLILKGNHDYWWSTRKKLENFLEENNFYSIRFVHNNAVAVDDWAVCGTRGWIYNAETDEDLKIVNREVGRLNLSLGEALKMGKEPIAFLHYPPIFDGQKCQEILDALLNANVKACYFGHIHGSAVARRKIEGEYAGIHMHLVSADYVNFTPVLVR